MPTWSDKLVAEVVRMLLDVYYDPQFSDQSTGFVPAGDVTPRCRRWSSGWKGTHWFIEGDIADCFGSSEHSILLSILGEKIHDGRGPVPASTSGKYVPARKWTRRGL